MALSQLFPAHTPSRMGLHTKVDIRHCLGPCPCAPVGLFPTEQSAACLERSDEVRDCKWHMTQTKDCTENKLNPAHKTDSKPHITHTKASTQRRPNTAHKTNTNLCVKSWERFFVI